MKERKNKQSPHYYLMLITLIAMALIKTQASEFKPLAELSQQKFTDQAQIVRLADQQKFSIPLNGRYISYNLQYYPQKSSDCTFTEPGVQYKKLAQSNKMFDEDDQVVDILILKRSEKVILADPYYNIVIYSIDEHKLLRLLSPKTSLKSSNNPTPKDQKMLSSLSMITTQQQDYVYYLSPNNSFVFSSKSFGTNIQRLDIEISSITKAMYYKSHIIIMSVQDGINAYKVNKTTHKIQKVQSIINNDHSRFIDMELDKEKQIFYVLTEKQIRVLLFQKSQFPNPQTGEFIVLKEIDRIQLLNYTKKHPKANMQNNRHLNLEISKKNNSQQQSIFVLFQHNMRQNVIAQFVYEFGSKQVTFLRYFKFQMLIRQIHVIQDVLMVVGNQILGMFPFGIDPRLITEEFNGWITMSNIEKVAVKEAPYFVGITKNTIQYGGLLFSKEAGLNCQFTEGTLTKQLSVKKTFRSIKFSGNLTWCNSEISNSYSQYCSYSKKFILQPMDIVTTSVISSGVWAVMLVCIVAIVLGILIMLVMHKQKQDEIRKLELYFDQKRKTQVPASSDRRGTNNL